ncbi:hypothetical protein H4O18_16825 [Arenibacter sp. BSSL-BM3]|uniref:Transcriptional regulator n=1 Tax=Arenibacter arenosicollis TaxID=2762274 RepID=A0ABR7QRS0_9FLAO|nr:hypothetical protein [Arenibacter arenosicollis]MBC8769665.1 hypothetical protein [Arenibacter arenosicollis]
MNYIKHLNGVFLQFSKDHRLNPTHISLYVGLFQLWNNYHFRDSFHINREEVMAYAKIGSKSTYHRCLKELDHWKYLKYIPSHNPFQGSRIKMFNFGTSDGQVVYPYSAKNGTSNGQVVVRNNKHIQTLKNNTKGGKHGPPQNENEVVTFFKDENWPITEAKKFYNHYQSVGWKLGGTTEIVNWFAIARKWMLKETEFKAEKTIIPVSQNTDNLKTSSMKNFNQPL